MTIEEVDEQLSYHTMSASQLARSQEIRMAAKYFATAIINNTKSSADQSAAIRHVRDALMTANAAIALER